MSPRTRDVLEAWTIGIFALIALAMALTGCRTTDAETITSVEEALVDRTAQYADKLGVKVRGVITNKLSPYTDPNAIGWFADGVAYYYRPRVALYVRLIPTPGMMTVSSVAGHEVCHAVSHEHDLKHWDCMAAIATPTYRRPE